MFVFCPCDHLRCAVHRPRACLCPGPPPGLVRACPPRGDGSAASCRNDYRGRRFRGCSVVHIHLRIGRKRHSCALRPASTIGDSGPLPLRAESHVHRGRTCPGWRRALLRIVAVLGYTGIFFLVTHFFVMWYEEPALRRTFGQEYEAYCDRVGRW